MLHQIKRQRTVAVNSLKKGETAPECIPSYDWRDVLKVKTTKAVPAWCFSHVALSEEMKQLEEQKQLTIQVELLDEEYPDPEQFARKGCDIYWIAEPIEYFGYMAKIKYAMSEEDARGEHHTRFINMITEAKSIGFIQYRGDTARLGYPKSYKRFWAVTNQDVNWFWPVTLLLRGCERSSLSAHLTIAGELKGNYKNSFQVGQTVEALDKSCISQMRVATVIKLVGGRVHVRYWDSNANPGEADFVAHERSQAVFQSGWCLTVGHDLSAPSTYISTVLNDETMKTYMNYDLMPYINIEKGMWLETVDPLNPSVIAAARISKVLKYGYIMVTIERHHESTTKCFHITSSLLLSCGYCKRVGISLIPPIKYIGSRRSGFCWKSFLDEKNRELMIWWEYPKENAADQGIEVGMKLEAVDLMEPRHVCVATVSQVKGRLLRIAFDGWGNTFDQWMVWKSKDLFPIGWCEANQYPLRAPRAGVMDI